MMNAICKKRFYRISLAGIFFPHFIGVYKADMKTGTLKTTIGNPDTYFVRENGKYVFVAYTTQQDNIYSKLNEDIKKCLDTQKTGS